MKQSDKHVQTDQQIERVKQWVNALRSGGYSQGSGSLRKHDDYCCLGVGCDIHRQYGHGTWGDGPIMRRYYPSQGPGPESEYLPTPVQEFFGIQGSTRGGDPNVVVPRHISMEYGLHPHQILTVLNDNHQITFDEIADIIEYNFLPESEWSKDYKNPESA